MTMQSPRGLNECAWKIVLTILFQMKQRGQADCLEDQKKFLCLVKAYKFRGISDLIKEHEFF